MLFLCNQLYLSVTSVFEQKTVVFEENIVKQKKCKKELKPNFNKKKNLSTVKEKSESEFVKSGPLDIGRSISLSATCPPAFRLVQDQMRSTGETKIHQHCPELFEDGSKNYFEKILHLFRAGLTVRLFQDQKRSTG